ncbi:class I SAM-dependent DNA methyltransferase [Poseidonibacter ostreae]|uniref:Methyltransferase domain-containing protein n=1 Tax=Poseidonibacter ostreae TaxID=2654171 RepID=A0A6L4WVP7_9BACT|nr:class I SAM-dependent methyltransferase [Poseidonibacter ostreae]KAB7887317.1 methyltransferase domain-containing protein [Poseidonibacter ostreae]KAB7890258.1 methyltransferase domain-containing protein [Poseidonibacter ostreae]KAB7890838.1 methyltransferase domain-containing protein [Poseidonibacter ostreae]MAC82940.1 SAM-dependent methyltransferase [Arcobacter sp.]
MNRFDEAAKTWDKRQVSIESSDACVQDLLNNVKLKNNANILDYGCGTGFIAFALKNETNNVTGMDYSKGMIEVFNNKVSQFDCENIKAIKHNMNEDELPKNTYDLIISSKTMHHIKDTNMFFKKSYNALKNDGILCINDLDKEDGSFHKDKENDGVEHFGYEKEELLAIAKNIGFKILSYKIVYNQLKNEQYYPLFNLIVKK